MAEGDTEAGAMKPPPCALSMAESGIPVFPCKADKRPATPHGFKDASYQIAQIEMLWRNHPAPLIGMPTGAASGLDLLDIDPRHDGDHWVAEYAPYLGDTRTIQTRSGGTHFFYKHLSGVRNSESQIADGVDVRGEGGYAILWACSGGLVVRDLPAADWPEWLGAIALDPPGKKRKASVEGGSVKSENSRRREYVSGATSSRTIHVKRSDRRTAAEIALDLIADAIVRVERAPGGQRHYELRAASRMAGGLLDLSGISTAEATRRLLHAVTRAGAEDQDNAEKTIASGLQLGKSEAFEIKRAF